MSEDFGKRVYGLEFDEGRIEELRRRGKKIISGDVTDPELWRRIELDCEPQLFVLALPGHREGMALIEAIRRHHPRAVIAITTLTEVDRGRCWAAAQTSPSTCTRAPARSWPTARWPSPPRPPAPTPRRRPDAAGSGSGKFGGGWLVSPRSNFIRWGAPSRGCSRAAVSASRLECDGAPVGWIVSGRSSSRPTRRKMSAKASRSFCFPMRTQMRTRSKAVAGLWAGSGP